MPLCSVESLNRGIGAGFCFHGDECEAAGALAYLVGDEADLGDRAMLSEGVLKIVFSHVKGEVSDV